MQTLHVHTGMRVYCTKQLQILLCCSIAFELNCLESVFMYVCIFVFGLCNRTTEVTMLQLSDKMLL